jgi:hypothetical protein
LLTLVSQVSGQGKNEEVTIIAPYIPSIGNAIKTPFRPEVNPQQEALPDFDYQYISKRHETRMELDPVEPLKYSAGQKEQLYRNYAKAGIGNYMTPYLDFMAGSLQSEKYQFGARLKHHSSQGKIKGYPDNAYSHNLINVYGRAFTKSHTFSADVGYDRDVVHFYGFAPDSFPDVDFTDDDIKQRFQHIHGNIAFGSHYTDRAKLGHEFGLGLDYFTDFYGTKETDVNFSAGFEKGLDDIGRDYRHSALLDFGLEYIGYRDSISSSNPVFISIRPLYRFAFSQYRFEAGFKISLLAENNPAGSSFGFDVFPILKAEVIIMEEKLKAYAEITGDRTINTFRSLAGINPYIVSTPEVKQTDRQFSIGGGISGNAGGMNFLAEASYSFLQNMPLYVNDTLLTLQNRFNVIYDNMNLLNIKASLGYVKVKDLQARLLANYYHYIPVDEEKAWQMPNYEIGLDAGYTFLEKYTLRASIMMIGSRYALVYNEGLKEAVKMKTAVDIGFGAEYRINKMISAFADVNNILNQNYQRWYEYPVQSILVMAGVKLTF